MYFLPADIPVRFAPEIAGNVPVKLAAGMLVRLAADIAGYVRDSFVDDIPVMSASITAPAFINCTSVCDIYSD